MKKKLSCQRKGEKVERWSSQEIGLEKVAKDLSSPEDPRSQQSKLIVPGEILKPEVMVKKRRNKTKSPAERYSIDSGKGDEVCKLKNELSTAMQQNQHEPKVAISEAKPKMWLVCWKANCNKNC